MYTCDPSVVNHVMSHWQLQHAKMGGANCDHKIVAICERITKLTAKCERSKSLCTN